MAISHPIVRAAGPAQFGSISGLSRRRYWFDRLSAGLDDKGMPVAWSHRFAGSYDMRRMNEARKIEVHIVPSSELPGGMGEAGTSAIVPAVANAIFAATGKRLRRMPIDAAALKEPN